MLIYRFIANSLSIWKIFNKQGFPMRQNVLKLTLKSILITGHLMIVF